MRDRDRDRMKKAAVTQGVTHTWEEVFVCVRTIDRSVESHSDPVNLPCVLSAESKFQISDHPLRHGAVISNLSHKPPLTFPFTLSTTLKRPLSFSLILFLPLSHTHMHTPPAGAILRRKGARRRERRSERTRHQRSTKTEGLPQLPPEPAALGTCKEDVC